MLNRLAPFDIIKVKVKAPGGFTFIDPSKPLNVGGHPLFDGAGNSYTDKVGKVLLFERTTLPQGYVGEVPKTPEVEAGLKKEIRIGKRDPISRLSDTITQLIEIKPVEKNKPGSSFQDKRDEDDANKRKDKGGK